jgi:hypothetical protein
MTSRSRRPLVRGRDLPEIRGFQGDSEVGRRTRRGLRVDGQRLDAQHAARVVSDPSQHLEPTYALRLLEERPEGVGYLMKERVGRRVLAVLTYLQR